MFPIYMIHNVNEIMRENDQIFPTAVCLQNDRAFRNSKGEIILKELYFQNKDDREYRRKIV